MTWMTVFLGVAASAAGLCAAADEKKEKDKDKKAPGRHWSFDSDKAGGSAAGFKTEVGEWKVVADDSAPSSPNVLAQTAKSSGPTFNVILMEGSAHKDLKISVKMKSVAGEVDQGGGLVWRAKDAKNYYVARFNPLEENFRLYKIVDGKRSQLKTADLELGPGWHDLRFEMKGSEIACYVNGKKLLEAQDDTFKEAGKIGFWTKADAQTHFDDLKVEE